MMRRLKTVHLLSGGLDSVTALYMLRSHHDIHCLLFDYDQRHKQELEWAKYHALRLGVRFTTMTLPPLGGLTEQSWIVPNRNAIFLSVAVNVAAQIEFDTVTIGCNADDHNLFPDCRSDFFQSMNDTVGKAGYSVHIWSPLIGLRKWEVLAMAQEHGIRLSETWTCYKGGSKPCGECPACKTLASQK